MCGTKREAIGVIVATLFTLPGCFYEPPPLEQADGTSGGSGGVINPTDPPGHEATSYPSAEETETSGEGDRASTEDSSSSTTGMAVGSSSETGSTSASAIDPCVFWGQVCRPDDPEEGEATCRFTIQTHLDNTGEECAEAYLDWYLCRAREADCAGQKECFFHLEIVMEICNESTFTSGTD